MSWTGKEKPQEKVAEERDPTIWDVVHHRNPKTGKVYNSTHYAYIVQKTGQTYYIRDGKKYYPDGTPMDPPAVPKAIIGDDGGDPLPPVDPGPKPESPAEKPLETPQPKPEPEPEKPAEAVDEMAPKSKRNKKPKIDESPLKNVSAR